MFSAAFDGGAFGVIFGCCRQTARTPVTIEHVQRVDDTGAYKNGDLWWVRPIGKTQVIRKILGEIILRNGQRTLSWEKGHILCHFWFFQAIFGALDDTQFSLCVVEGWGAALTPGVKLPGVGPPGVGVSAQALAH